MKSRVWGAAGDGCEEGSGVGMWQVYLCREVSKVEVAAAELWESELRAGSTSSLRISKRFMLTFM